ncbi:MAG: cation:dicarboxylase symporter family transporter, partial [Bacteroidetes bacterium]|nr:cation:dicarboxylase symporter family transporter [Bacteroidota bacterium]
MKIPKFFTHLTFYVLVALVLAVLLGYLYPAVAIKAEPLGTWFVNVIKVFIPPIIFLTIVTGISGMSNLKKVGR